MKLNKQQMFELLDELNYLLAEDGVYADILVVGGSALILGYSLREASMDIDAVINSSTDISKYVARVASNHPGVLVDWLNQNVRGFVEDIYGYPETGSVVYQGSNAVLTVPEPSYLLMMKLYSMRPMSEDEQDVINLVNYLGLTTFDEVNQSISPYGFDLHNTEYLHPKKLATLKDLLASHGIL